MVTYGYDAASRLGSVSEGALSATYTYETNSALIASTSFKQSGITRMTTSRQYDRLNRLTRISHASATATTAFDDRYNDAHQRTRVTQADGSQWLYEYDNLGQVVSGRRIWADGSPIAGQQFEDAFDTIGNRTVAKSGGDATGGNLRSSSLIANLLNQVTNRTVPGGFDVLGAASAGTPVTVNGSPADGRRDEYFHEAVSVNNTSAAVWQGVTVTAGTNTASGNRFVPQTPETISYDLDGNTIQDGRWVYTWDGENRLTAMESLASGPSGSKRKIVFEYDYQSRRIRRQVYIWNGSGYPGTANGDTKYLYDGWNVIAELDGSNARVRTYAWGQDLGGGRQRAGGVGGALWLTVHMPSTSSHFYRFDGNGNVTGLASVSDGTSSAQYEYGPFGEPLRATGTAARANPMRFSTESQDDETGLLYYGYRFNNLELGRWPSRDPITEQGGSDIHGFLDNNPINRYDPVGLAADLEPPSALQPCDCPAPITEDGTQTAAFPSLGSDELDDIASVTTSRARKIVRCKDLLAANTTQFWYASPDSFNRARGAGGVVVPPFVPDHNMAVTPPGKNACNKPVERAAAAPGIWPAHAGHMIPRKWGGRHTVENIVTQEARFNLGAFRNEIQFKIEKEVQTSGCGGACLTVIPLYRLNPVHQTGRMPAPAGFLYSVIIPSKKHVDVKYLPQPIMNGDYQYENGAWYQALVGAVN